MSSVDSSEQRPAEPAPSDPSALTTGPSSAAVPPAWRSILLVGSADLDGIWRSWLSRGFLLVSALVTLLMLKGMQAEQKSANQMLEAVYAMYLVVWMHGVIFIAGSAFLREQDCLNDAILSRGLTRAEYFWGKFAARTLAILLIIGGLLVPASFWAIRHDKLVRTEGGFVVSQARNTKIEAWNPKKLFAQVAGQVVERKVELGDSVQAGDILSQLDDRPLFDDLEMERRAEENARNEVQNAQRLFEEAQRKVGQAEDALTRAERALIAKDLLNKAEQADREMEIRARKRDLKDAETRLRTAQAAIPTAERSVETAQARVRESRKRMTFGTILAPVSGYVTEMHVEPAQPVAIGTHLFTVAPLDEFQVQVPIYSFDEFKRLKAGLPAFIKVGDTEFEGSIERLGATTKADRWGRESNFAVVRFKGNGALGLLGRDADVRLSLPPPERRANRAAALLDTLTGRGADDLKSRTTSVTVVWMCVALGKVLASAVLVVALTFFFAVAFRSALVAILAGAGLWHISNLVFDFVGLPDVSYMEMVRTMDKVLGGVAKMSHELAGLGWLAGIAVSLALGAVALFVVRDPPR